METNNHRVKVGEVEW